MLTREGPRERSLPGFPVEKGFARPSGWRITCLLETVRESRSHAGPGDLRGDRRLPGAAGERGARPGRDGGGQPLLRDGEPWVAEGATLVGLIAPEERIANKRRAMRRRERRSAPSMLAEVRRYGADLVRLQVSQASLDPKSKRHDPAYRAEVLDAIAETRAAGYNVVVAMEWKGTAGRRDSNGLPTASTRRAWRVIAAEFGGDRGVLFELFNEPPDNPRTPAEWEPWQESMQATIDALRKSGAQNVLLARRDAVLAQSRRSAAARRSARAARLRHASLPRPSITRRARSGSRKWGGFARTHPVMATEFNADAGGSLLPAGARGAGRGVARLLREKRIGVVAWALDMPSVRGRTAATPRSTTSSAASAARRARRRRADDPRVLPSALSSWPCRRRLRRPDHHGQSLWIVARALPRRGEY